METSSSGLVKSRKVALVAIFSALLVVVRLIRIPVRVPGFGGLLWLIILMLSSVIIPTNFSATQVAFIGGLFSSFIIDTPPGPYHLVKYLSAGITMDLLNKLTKTHGVVSQVIIGAVSYGVSIIATIATFSLFGIKMQALALGILYVILLHMIFGGIGGIISYTIASRVRKGNLLLD